jgi:hypothetical protein
VESEQNVYVPCLEILNAPDREYIWKGQFWPSTPINPSPEGWGLQSGEPSTNLFRTPSWSAVPIVVVFNTTWPTKRTSLCWDTRKMKS